MHSENMFIQQQCEILRLQANYIEKQNEIKLLQKENIILDTALLNACQSICRSLDYSQEEINKMKQKFISRAKDNYERAFDLNNENT
jgi:hypothetical protein